MKRLVSTLLLLAVSIPIWAANDHYKPGDLVSVHWDSSYDYDDLQAMPATRAILDAFSGVNYMVVNGARSHEHDGILQGSSAVMRMVFPDGLDAHNARAQAIQEAADRWQSILRTGATVHVAEGGPSDFTAAVLRELQSRQVSGLKRIRVVQHSFWNEDKTSAASLRFVKNTATYLKIQDGNSHNQTARLRTDAAQTQTFRNLAERSQYSHVWEIAFQAAKNPARTVDFSDAVEVLHVMDVPRSSVSDAFEFANRFFRDGKQGESGNEQSSDGQSESPVDRGDAGRVAVFGQDLNAARTAYRQATDLPRVDCDRSGGGYVCASFRNPTIADVTDLTPAPESEPEPEPTPVEEPDAPAPALPVVNGGRVAVYAGNLRAAIDAYRQATSLPRVDCDPSGSGYICASFNNPTLADIEPVTDGGSEAEPEVPQYNTNRVAVYGSNLAIAKANYALATTLPRRDCDRSGSGYICASFNNPTITDVNVGAQIPEEAADAGQVEQTPTATPTPTPTPTPVASGQDTIRIEVENYSLGTGWVKDTARAGYSGSGYIRWAGGNLYQLSKAGAGVMQFDVIPATSGEYTVRLRSRAINPPASDLNNDVWIRIDGSAWKKMYSAGKDEWRVGGAIDDHNGHYVLTRYMQAGQRYRLEISGRSNGFAIDYIQLKAN